MSGLEEKMAGMEENLNKYVLDKELKSILDKMITNLLQDQPENIPQYMVDYLVKTYDLSSGAGSAGDANARSSIIGGPIEEKLEIEDDEEDEEDEECGLNERSYDRLAMTRTNANAVSTYLILRDIPYFFHTRRRRCRRTCGASQERYQAQASSYFRVCFF